MKFRKKPVVIDAELYRPGLEDCWLVLTSDRTVSHQARTESGAWQWLEDNSHLADHIAPGIKTLEGAHIVDDGDWIVTGVKGERYPCKPDIFAMTYEPAGSSEPPATETKAATDNYAEDLNEWREQELKFGGRDRD